MRISDWSSDVCSSDLRLFDLSAAVLQSGAGDGREAGQLRADARARPRRLRRSGDRLSLRPDAHALGPPAALALSRADPARLRLVRAVDAGSRCYPRFLAPAHRLRTPSPLGSLLRGPVGPRSPPTA